MEQATLSDQMPEVIPARRLAGRVVGVFATMTPDDFTTEALPELALGLDGIAGDRHHGFTRASGSREPWHPRGTEIRSRRQLSLVSTEDNDEVARRMGVDGFRPEWIGANLLVAGIPRFSFLPAGTRLHLDGGAVILVEHQNGPCRHAGRNIAVNTPGREDIELLFPKVARRLRGVVASIDRAGVARPGMAIEAHVPEQWVYRG